MADQQQCFSVDSLRCFITEELDEHQEAKVTAHIEVCSVCRAELERISWGRFEPQEMLRSLSPNDDINPRVDSCNSPLAISNLLAPTDDPTKLGRLGNYEVCGVIGRGSSGVVFKALDPRLSRYVAIKMLTPDYSASRHSRARFEREARAIAAVRDDCVIAIHGVSEFDGNPYIVMQYVPGESLQQRLNRQGPLATDETVRIGLQVATGLAAAHRQGIIHRDVKPANILLEEGLDRAVVTDFGLARVADEATMTRSGIVSGTPQYMSPEQAKGQPLDARTDLFSLGSVLYACCTGFSPFRHETLFGAIARVCDDTPQPACEQNPNVDKWLGEFISKLHSKERDERFESAQAVADLLAEELAHMQSPATAERPRRLWMRQPSQFTTSNGRSTWSVVIAAMATLLVVFGFSMARYAKTTNLWWAQTDTFRTESNDATQAAITQLRRSAREHFDNCEYGHAAGMYRLILHRRPDDPEAAAQLAGCLHLMGQVNEAIEWYRTALSSSSNRAQNHYNLACAYALLDNKRLAFDSLENAIESGFANVEHLKTDNDLQYLRDDARYWKLVQNAKLAR